MRRWVQEQLTEIHAARHFRQTQALEPLSPVKARLGQKNLILFSSNDYLGLSSHPDVIRRTDELLKSAGMGPRGASLLCGYTDLHRRLEKALADLKRTEAALLFPTGYMANLGILQTLGSPDTEIFSDRLNHASIIDGCRLSRSRISIYGHADIDQLETRIRSSSAAQKIIVTEALFSMDGDVAPLTEIAAIKRKYGALLVVDEAHSTLVFGKDGRGLADELGVRAEVDVQMGTLSKAFGALGGYVAVNRSLRELFVNRARSFIFTTSLPLPVVAAALAALETASSNPDLRIRLWKRISQLHSLLKEAGISDFPLKSASAPPPGPIRPIVIGSEQAALMIADGLLQRGFHVPAIRPPTVPTGTSRLRISVSAAHNLPQIKALVQNLRRYADQLPGKV